MLRSRLVLFIFIVKILSVVLNNTNNYEEGELKENKFITCGSTIRIRNSLTGYL